MTIYLSLLISLIGLGFFIYAAGNAKEVGRLAFWVGLLAFLLHFGGQAVIR